jgi:preprotein translocase subunit SecD
MGNIGPAVVSVIAGIIGLAIVAVIMSQRAQTPAVISAGGNALASVIGAAVKPVS